MTGFQTLSYDEIKAAVDVAHRAGKGIAAHSYSASGARDAVEAGASWTRIEHAVDTDDATLAEMARRRISLRADHRSLDPLFHALTIRRSMAFGSDAANNIGARSCPRTWKPLVARSEMRRSASRWAATRSPQMLPENTPGTGSGRCEAGHDSGAGAGDGNKSNAAMLLGQENPVTLMGKAPCRARRFA